MYGGGWLAHAVWGRYILANPYCNEPPKAPLMKHLAQFFAVLIVTTLAWNPTWAASASDVQIKDLVVGDGDEARRGAQVEVHYTGWTLDGNKFDSSVDHDKPFKFSLGARQVIPGWDIGVQGMRVGGKRELVIPSHLAYGERGAPPVIPPNATLKFEVELLAVSAPLYSDIDNEKLKALLARGVPIVDLRRKDEWDSTGVVEGSKLITAFDGRGAFVQSFVNEFSKVAGQDDEVIVICRTGNRTSSIAQALSSRLGYKKIYNVEHGITRWIKDGNPVVKP